MKKLMQSMAQKHFTFLFEEGELDAFREKQPAAAFTGDITHYQNNIDKVRVDRRERGLA